MIFLNISKEIVFLVVALIVFLLPFIFILIRTKKCPSDKIMVIYGMVKPKDKSKYGAVCIHGGAKFIWPIVQAYQFLDLTPINITVEIKNALSKTNSNISVLARFSVGISTEPEVMQNAAERLLGLSQQEIHEMAMDIIIGQIRFVVSTMEFEEINQDRDSFLNKIVEKLTPVIGLIGLRLINVNLLDIKEVY